MRLSFNNSYSLSQAGTRPPPPGGSWEPPPPPGFPPPPKKELWEGIEGLEALTELYGRLRRSLPGASALYRSAWEDLRQLRSLDYLRRGERRGRKPARPEAPRPVEALLRDAWHRERRLRERLEGLIQGERDRSAAQLLKKLSQRSEKRQRQVFRLLQDMGV